MRLPKNFFSRDTIEVARDLLGQFLVRRRDAEFRARIVETEAYLGPEDPACHTFGHRRTPRVESMYGRPGLAYVYFIYGVHFCLNVVTGSGEAVLIRALEAPGDPRRFSGPGKLCRELGITRAHDGLDLTRSDELFLAKGPGAGEIWSGPRVGLGAKHDAVHWPLRFGVARSPALSKPSFTEPSP